VHPTLLVVHSISLPPGEFGGPAIEELFINRLDPAAHAAFADLQSLRVSAHFLVRRDGELVQFVPIGARAWHAGASRWRARDRCNDFSIRRLEGTPERAMPCAVAQLARLVRALRTGCRCADRGARRCRSGARSIPAPASTGCVFHRSLKPAARTRLANFSARVHFGSSIAFGY
jgi:hypothetical protein